MRRDLALAEFRQLDPAEQRHCRAAIAQFVAAQARMKRTTMPNFHLWIRTGGFREFPNAKLSAVAPAPDDDSWIVEGSDADRALRFVRLLAKQPLPLVRQRSDGSRGYPSKVAVGADLLAMLAFVDDRTLQWPVYARGTPQCAAWQQKFVAWIGQPLPVAIGDAGIRAPRPWPPRKDGTLYEETEQEGAAETSHDVDVVEGERA